MFKGIGLITVGPTNGKLKKGKKGGDLENSHIFMEGPKWIGLVDW